MLLAKICKFSCTLNSNITITKFYANSDNPNNIVQSEYVKTFALNAIIIGKIVHCNGYISFTKQGLNVGLLSNLPFIFDGVTYATTSTWLNRGQAMLTCVNSEILGAFNEVAPDIQYNFNFTAMIKK